MGTNEGLVWTVIEQDQPTRFDRWWWLAWYVFFLSVLVWLGCCGWLARPLETWAQGWVGWWTADQMASRPNWKLGTYLVGGAEVVSTQEDPAFRLTNLTTVQLGRWSGEEEQWSWAAWVRVNRKGDRWPEDFIVTGFAQSPAFELRLGFAGGRPRAALRFASDHRPTNPLNRPWVQIEGMGDDQVPLDEWVHFAFTARRGNLGVFRIFVNGVPVREFGGYLNVSIEMADLGFTNVAYDPATRGGIHNTCDVWQDDLVLYDRMLSPEEVAALAAQKRGAWVPALERPVLAARVWRLGWPLALLTLVVLLALKWLPAARSEAATIIFLFTQPAYRSVRWTLIGGLLSSAVLAGGIAAQARRADEQRFTELLQRFKKDTETHWVKVNDLLVRSKEWIAAQTNLTQASWETWLNGVYYPHRYDGLLGIGFAQQVQPAQLAAHEAEWSARHEFAYQVHPPIAAPRQPVRELAGEPLLPVVLYQPRMLPDNLWFTNHTILGRDLLYQSPEDRRSWAEARRVEQVAARNEVQTSSLEEIAPAAWYGQVIRGVRLYVPWTSRTTEDTRLTLESSAWRGVLFASVDVERWLKDAFGTAASPLGFRLYTGRSTGERLDLVADSKNFLPGTEDKRDATLHRTVQWPFYHRQLILEAWTTHAFDDGSLRRWIWGIGAAGSAFTLLAGTLLIVQIRAREAQRRVLEALRAANSELLLAYRERENLSRDLHDGSIQNFYALGLHLQRVQALFDRHPKQAQSELKESVAMLDHSIEDLRQFILTSGIDNLKEHTLTTAIEALVMRFRRTTETEFDLRLDAATDTLSPQAGVQLINIVREGISNAMRHAQAKRIAISLNRIPQVEGEQGRWNLQVTDDGGGFDVKQVNGHGNGLRNLASRAAELGGKCEIQSTPGAGTRVTVEFFQDTSSV